MALVTSFAMWARGAVVAGPYIVYPKCWWRRTDRRIARRAAQLLKLEIRDQQRVDRATLRVMDGIANARWN